MAYCSKCGAQMEDAVVWDVGAHAPKESDGNELQSLRDMGLVLTDDAEDYTSSLRFFWK